MIILRVCCCFLLLFTFLSLPVSAQHSPVTFDHLSLEQGLPQSTPMCFLQDRKGFMWVGTQEGLCRYDGYTFQVFKHDGADPHSISSNLVRALHEDKEGQIWIGTFSGGLSCYNPATGAFTSYLRDAENPKSISHNRVEALLEDRKGNLWVATLGGLNRFDRKAKTFVLYQHDPADWASLSDNRAISLSEDAQGRIWIGTFNGLNRLDPQTGRFTRYMHDPAKSDGLAGPVVHCLYRDPKNQLWIGTNGGLQRWEPARRQFIRYAHDPANPQSLSYNVIFSLRMDQTGALWVGTKGGGLNRLDPQTGKAQRFVYDPTKPQGLSNNIVWAVYEDRGGVLWVGTDGGGINLYDRKKNQFDHFSHDPGNPNSLSDNIVWTFCEERSGLLWVGTVNGLNAFDRKTGKITRYYNHPTNPNSLSFNNVSSILEDHTGQLWIGTDGGGLNRFDRNTQKFTRYQYNPADSTSLTSNGVNQILEDRNQTLWIGTSDRGLDRFNPLTQTFTHFPHDPKDTNTPGSNHIMTLYLGRDDIIWIGTLGGGLDAFEPKSGHFTHYQYEKANSHSLNENRVIALYEDAQGFLWVGTAGGGLNRLDRKTGRFTHYTEKNGLPNNVVYGILPDKQGNLWLSTNQGITQFSPKNQTFRSFDVRDGIQNNEFNNWAAYRSRSGELFFGGIHGFNAFFPEQIKDNDHIPAIQLTDLKLRNRSVQPDSAGSPLRQPVSETREITLPYFENMLSLDFAALDFTAPDKHRYAYMLEGLDKAWIDAGTQHSATYTNLDPGQYTFRVKGTNNNGLWNERGSSLRIVITPPWWRTAWAYTLYTLTVLGLIGAFAWFQLNKIALKNRLRVEQVQAEKFQEIERIKTHFFTNISHEFRTPLTLILGPINQLLGENLGGTARQQVEMMQRNANRLLLLVNQLLDISKLETGKMSLSGSRADVVLFVRPVVESFRSLTDRKQIALHLEAEPEEIMLDFDGDKLEKIFYNLLSNAYKFTPSGGSITVKIRPLPPEAQNVVEFRVEDTGIGIPAEQLPRIFDRYYQVEQGQFKDQPGTGIGLALVKDLVELHGGRIEANSTVGKGTEFVVILPVQNEKLMPQSSLSLTEQVPAVEALAWEEMESASAERKDQRPLVLLVEDNTDMRAYIRSFLAEAYQLVEATNGREGAEKAIDMVPDLIISDVMMPEMDGTELCGYLKKEEKTSHIPIILLTAKSSRESRLEGLSTGADDYLNKPFDASELLLRVGNAIRNRNKLVDKLQKALLFKPSESTIPSMEEAFLQKIVGLIEVNMADENFSVEELGRQAGMSRTQIHRKLSALTNQSASDLIRTLRLNRALEMLRSNAGTVSDIAYAVGFSSPNYFARCFHQEYGYSPSDFKKQAASY